MLTSDNEDFFYTINIKRPIYDYDITQEIFVCGECLNFPTASSALKKASSLHGVKMTEQKNVIVVGGGFAGTAAIRNLNCRLPNDYKLVVISEESYTTFHPMLPEAVGASIFPEQVVAPLREILGQRSGSQFIMGKVKGIDMKARTLDFTSLAGNRSIAYQHLIITCGNRARIDMLPGMKEHAIPLKTWVMRCISEIPFCADSQQVNLKPMKKKSAHLDILW
ncbi:FAD-dependent oxidoreductase [Undibacterium sp. Ji67W]|uniref:FAD-dependent oxidoreductase n=1 Tax=Undibacterium sp. Ji67W TaxID=3413042 RepID=UPI003BEF82B6